MPDLSNVIQLLYKEEYLQTASPAEINREVTALVRLQRKPPTFQNRYAIVFRYVSILLLSKGYAITGKSPHKTFSVIAAQFMPEECIQKVVKCRHQNKYEQSPVSSDCYEILDKLQQEIQKVVQYF